MTAPIHWSRSPKILKHPWCLSGNQWIDLKISINECVQLCSCIANWMTAALLGVMSTLLRAPCPASEAGRQSPISLIRQHPRLTSTMHVVIETQAKLVIVMVLLNDIFLSVIESLYPWCGKHKLWFCVSYFISSFWALVPYFILLSSLKIAGGHWAWYNNGQNNTRPTGQADLLTIVATYYYCSCHIL